MGSAFSKAAIPSEVRASGVSPAPIIPTYKGSVPPDATSPFSSAPMGPADAAMVDESTGSFAPGSSLISRGIPYPPLRDFFMASNARPENRLASMIDFSKSAIHESYWDLTISACPGGKSLISLSKPRFIKLDVKTSHCSIERMKVSSMIFPSATT